MSYCWHSLGLVPISQSQTLFSFSQTHGIFARQRVPCSLLQEMSVVEPSSQYQYQQQNYLTSISRNPSVGGDDDGDEEEGISKIGVPRQKHIPVSKSQLLDAILSIMFNQSQDVSHHFRLLTSCLDSILHAEHKSILEEMRSDYQLANSLQTHSSLTQLVNIPNVNTKDSDMLTDDNDIIAIQEDANLYDDQQDQREKSVLPYPALDLTALLRSLDIASTKKDYDSGGSRVTIGTRFQHAFMKLLSDAQFEELSARDLMLTSALNTDYLLTLPIYVDWKRAYESNAIIFRAFGLGNILDGRINISVGGCELKRGYATEKQKGLLIVEKLDYLQSKILRGTFFVISKPLKKLGSWISELYENGSQRHEIENWTESLRLWLKELSVFQKSLLYNDPDSDEHIGINQEPNAELPIWLAAQRAVARYEGILSQVGPRGRLLRRMLSWIGLIPPLPETPFEVHNDNNTPEPHLRSAILLDVVAISALIIYGSRVVLGYKQTWDRYQLLVNKTLNEKTLASGFGSVHFLLDASEQQQYKEAVLAYAILLKAEKGQVISRQTVGEKCERFLYEVFKVKVEMPIDKALNTLLRLGLATETCIDGNRGLLAIPCPKAYEALKERWNILLC
ncbi:uncharacterized protein HKW66_Vig0211110 [Vigna angularis]|uniref:Uncharacterized protein n=1 Tax=Phaseolus angularis TaxID=3914 RepID=A0A8T0JDT0_PHAAN|nr:uncharacterized protein HKW66_Vig0211110 [Vigna angularis]